MVGQLQQMIDSFQSSTDQLASNITANVRAEVQHQIQMMVGKYVSELSLINHTASHLIGKLLLRPCCLFTFK